MPDDITRILQAAQDGDECAAAQLLPIVYEDLRKLARFRLAHEKHEQSLQATALVHEAYVRLPASPMSKLRRLLAFPPPQPNETGYLLVPGYIAESSRTVVTLSQKDAHRTT